MLTVTTKGWTNTTWTMLRQGVPTAEIKLASMHTACIQRPTGDWHHQPARVFETSHRGGFGGETGAAHPVLSAVSGAAGMA